MWIYSSKESTWVNTERCLRLFRDGGAGWGFKSEDGQVTHITDDEYNKFSEIFNRKKPDHKDTLEELRKRLDALEHSDPKV